MVHVLRVVLAGIDGCMDGSVDVMDPAVARDVRAVMARSMVTLAVDE